MTKKTGGKGSDFEERLRAYFDQAGFFAVRGVPFLFEGEVVSDIDVWLYERPTAVSRRRTIVDAKSKSKPKAVERIVWLKGFQAGLGVESAIVATTDRRASVKRFAASLGIAVLDGEAVQRLIQTERLAPRLTGDELQRLLSAVDKKRGSKEWRNRFNAAKAGLASELGFLSANNAFDSAKFYLDATLMFTDQDRETAIRAFLACASYAAVSLDFALKDLAFHSTQDRQKAVEAGIRYGDSANSPVLETINLAKGLLRSYLDNGPAVARQLEGRLAEEAASIPAEILGEYVAKVAQSDTLFQVARELDALAYSLTPTSYEDLTLETRSFLGVTLDYMRVPRKKFTSLFPFTGARRKIVERADVEATSDELPLRNPARGE